MEDVYRTPAPSFEPARASVASAQKRYMIRRKFFKIFGGAIPTSNKGGHARLLEDEGLQAEEDLRVYSDEDMRRSSCTIKARAASSDLGMTYDVMDATTGQRIGALRRRLRSHPPRLVAGARHPRQRVGKIERGQHGARAGPPLPDQPHPGRCSGVMGSERVALSTSASTRSSRIDLDFSMDERSPARPPPRHRRRGADVRHRGSPAVTPTRRPPRRATSGGRRPSSAPVPITASIPPLAPEPALLLQPAADYRQVLAWEDVPLLEGLVCLEAGRRASKSARLSATGEVIWFAVQQQPPCWTFATCFAGAISSIDGSCAEDHRHGCVTRGSAPLAGCPPALPCCTRIEHSRRLALLEHGVEHRVEHPAPVSAIIAILPRGLSLVRQLRERPGFASGVTLPVAPGIEGDEPR